MRHLRVFGSPRQIAVVVLLLCLAAAAHAAEHHKELAKRIDTILARPELARSFWGVEIQELETGSVVYSHDADRLFTPASNTKLFTTAATLALIGPDYHFRTTIESTSAPDKYGRISGDLVLVGRGDPNLSGRSLPYMLKTERPMPPEQALAELADQIVARGIKVVDGDIVADDSFYVYERYGEGWSQDDLVWEWGAPVSALSVNDNVVFLNILPGEHAGDHAFITLSPYAGYFHVENQVMTAPGGFPRKVYVQRQPGSNRLEIWGNIPLDDTGAGEAVAIDDPADFCARLLSELLAKRGVVIYGKVRVRHTPIASLGTITVNTNVPLGGGGEVQPGTSLPVVLAERTSVPLSFDVQVVNKVSQNLHAEMMLRLLGREKGTSGSIAAGLEVLRTFLSRADVRPEEYVFYDGSGLSRQNLVSPHATVKLLRYASQQSWSAVYTASLPLAGVDGTMASRLKDLPAGAVVRAKTGSLDHVNAVSGYLTTSRGERFAFSIMCNNHTLQSRPAGDIIDEILLAAEHIRN